MPGCEYKSKCNLRDLLKGNIKEICEQIEPFLPTGPGPDSFLFAEYCPAWRDYKSEEKRELVPAGPVVDKYALGWVDWSFIWRKPQNWKRRKILIVSFYFIIKKEGLNESKEH